MGWIVLWTDQDDDVAPPVGEDSPSFCPSWPTDADDPGVRKSRATGFVSNRNMNGQDVNHSGTVRRCQRLSWL